MLNRDYGLQCGTKMPTRLRFEALEDRRMLAVLTVNTLGDTIDHSPGNSALSLREAIEVVNTSSTSGLTPQELSQINLAQPLGTQDTILLTNLSGTITLILGELQVQADVVINGPASSTLSIDASGNDPTPTSTPGDFEQNGDLNTDNDYDGSRVFSIGIVNVTIRNVTLTGGDVGVSGSAIFGGRDLTLENIAVTSNYAAGGGAVAGVVNALVVVDSIVSENESAGFGGGGILATGASTVIRRSEIAANISGTRNGFGELAAGGFGGGLSVSGNNIVIEDCIISENEGVQEGGGIYLSLMPGQTAAISRTVIAGNKAAFDRFIGGPDGGAWFGGGARIFNGGGTVTIAQCWIRDNIIGNSNDFLGGVERGRRGTGGGLHLHTGNGGVTTIKDSTVSGNRARQTGGGITVVNTGAETTTHLLNMTVSGNSADETGGGMDIGNDNGFGSTVLVAHSTITSNTVPEFPERDFSMGGGIHFSSSLLGVTLDHTIVANNTDTNDGLQFVGGDANGNPVFNFGTSPDFSASHMLDGDPNTTEQFTVNAPYSIIGNPFVSTLAVRTVNPSIVDDSTVVINGIGLRTNVAPLLGPLQDNGGFALPDGTRILTHALLTGSPAIDAGNPALVAGVGGTPQFDERGPNFLRIFDTPGVANGGIIDIGAFELQPIVDVVDADFDNNTFVDGTDFLIWQRGLGLTNAAPGQGDADFDEDVDGNDLAIWRAQFGMTLPVVVANVAPLSFSTVIAGLDTLLFRYGSVDDNTVPIVRKNDAGVIPREVFPVRFTPVVSPLSTESETSPSNSLAAIESSVTDVSEFELAVDKAFDKFGL